MFSFSFLQNCTPSSVTIHKMDNSDAEHISIKSAVQTETKPSGTIQAQLHNCNPRATDPPGNEGPFCLSLSKQEADIPEIWQQADALQPLGAEDLESCDGSPRSPMEEQKMFHSEFYSLCRIGSNRSLSSSLCSVERDRDCDQDNSTNSFQSRVLHPAFITNRIKSKEFDDISRQIAKLSRTVDELNQSFNSLNSGGSGGSNPDFQGVDVNAGLEEDGACWNVHSGRQVMNTHQKYCIVCVCCYVCLFDNEHFRKVFYNCISLCNREEMLCIVCVCVCVAGDRYCNFKIGKSRKLPSLI